jgi:hypothetical protein
VLPAAFRRWTECAGRQGRCQTLSGHAQGHPAGIDVSKNWFDTADIVRDAC